MTPEEFEGFLTRTRAKLIAAFKKAENVTEMDGHTKTILDYQEEIAKKLFDELNGLEQQLVDAKGAILRDARERHQLLMQALTTKNDGPTQSE